MKEFNLEAAKQGAKVCTRDGRAVRILWWNAKGDCPIVALIPNDKEGEEVRMYPSDGRIFFRKYESPLDLMMATNKKVGWVNIYPRRDNYIPCSHIFTDELSAYLNKVSGCIKTQKVEWEE